MVLPLRNKAVRQRASWPWTRVHHAQAATAWRYAGASSSGRGPRALRDRVRPTATARRFHKLSFKRLIRSVSCRKTARMR
ncbi:hypothetical protein ebA5552 [Aromatoleum aromaticum EbN1]|uniref:Uncharacterized protein n=1 Tax=Aromatoleum aromaticum (strain DSM 19018 / LMG 30748 / EbN1) TaxID=76114 RepID=Q5P078_AROAE|nr:hypothetical protein ebA5552 [Aromatoleum aromaticum EbN1]